MSVGSPDPGRRSHRGQVVPPPPNKESGKTGSATAAATRHLRWGMQASSHHNTSRLFDTLNPRKLSMAHYNVLRVRSRLGKARFEILVIRIWLELEWNAGHRTSWFMSYDPDTDLSDDSIYDSYLVSSTMLLPGTAAVDWPACVTRATWLACSHITVRLRQPCSSRSRTCTNVPL